MTNEGTSREDDPDRVFLTKPIDKSIQKQLLEMLIQKGFSTCVLCAVIWALYTNLTNAIPLHIRAINDGVESISKADREARQQDAKEDREARQQDALRHVEAVRMLTESQRDEREKARAAAEQLERILTNKMNVVARRVEENAKKIEQEKELNNGQP